MITKFCPATLAVAFVLQAASAHAQYVVIAGAQTQVGPLERTEWTVAASPNPIDTFKMTRWVKRAPEAPIRGSILLLPALGTTFALYEQRDAGGGLGTSIAEFFALRNYDVYGYSPRFEGIPAGSCEAGVVDCSAMAGWDIQSMLDDISYVRDQIDGLQPGSGVVAGGLSLGGILAVAVANHDGGRYDGIFPWEGMLVSNDPAVQGLNAGYCAALDAQLAGGVIFDGVGNGLFKAIAQAARTRPDSLTTNPLFPPFFTAHQVLVLTLSVPAPGPVSMPVPGYVTVAGSFGEDRFFFASEDRLLENVVGTFNNYVPNALVRDVSCALAGVDATHTGNLGAFNGSVLMIGGGLGFGGFMQDQLAAFTGASDATLLVEPGFGHVDHFMSPQHRRFAEFPILDWLRRVLR